MAHPKRKAFFSAFLLIFPSLLCTIIAAPRHPAGQLAESPNPAVKRETLLNGLQILTFENSGSGKVSARLRVNSGALFDLAGKGGLADLTAGMILKGGGGLTASNVVDTVEQLGLSINVTVNWDATDIEMSGPADAVDTILDLLSKLIVTPAFEAKELEAIKAQRLGEIQSAGNRDEDQITNKAMEVVYGTHPFGRPMRGTATSIQQISRHDLVFYHNRYYLANNAMLIIAGDVTAAQVSKLARTKLGGWKKGDRVSASFRPPEIPSNRRVLYVDQPGATDTLSLIAQVGVSRRASDYLAALVMVEVLRARLSKAIGGRARLELSPRMVEGPLTILIPSQADEAVAQTEKAISEMIAMQTYEPSADQVEAAKSTILSRFSDRVSNRPAELLFDIELYGLGKDYIGTFGDRVRLVSPAEIQKAAQKYLRPQSLSLVFLGPATKLQEAGKKLGAVTIGA